jgi:hypothetical protein
VADRSMQVSIVNQRKLEKALRAIGKDAVDDLKKAHLESAKIVERAARPKVPVRSGSSSVVSGKPYWPSSRSTSGGSLKGTLRSGASSRAGVVRIGKKLVPYAGPVHFGWPSRPNLSKGWRGGPIPPDTFLYDALDERRGEVEDAFYRYLEDIKKRHL